MKLFSHRYLLWVCAAYALYGFAALQICVHLFIPPEGYSLSENLYGSALLPSFGVLLMAISPVLFCLGKLARKGVGGIAFLLFALSALVSLHALHISRNDVYTNDMWAHIARMKYVMEHPFSPFGYSGPQFHQFPLYYYVAAGTLWLNELTLRVPQLTALHFLSWLCYLAFSYFSLLTVSRAGLSRGARLLASALLLLWPLGLHMAVKISNEPLYYAFYAATFYFALQCYTHATRRLLAAAFCFGCLALLAKGNALILLAILALLGWRQRQQLLATAHSFSKNQMLAMAVVACACAMLLGSMLSPLAPQAWLGIFGPGNKAIGITHFLFVNIPHAIAHPFNDWSDRQSFWDYAAKSAIFGEYSWPWAGGAAVLYILLVALCIWGVGGLLCAPRRFLRGMGVYVAGFGIPILASIGYTLLAQQYTAQDVRYIYPALTCLVILLGRSFDIYKGRGRVFLAYTGVLLASLFMLASIVFFWTQVR